MTENEQAERERRAVALFRYGVIADLLHETAGLYARLREKAARDYEIPGSTRRRVAVETIRDWLRAYKKSGFDGLLPKERSDNGLTRAIPREISDLLVELKEETRALSVPQLITQARATGECQRNSCSRRRRCTGCLRSTGCWTSNRRARTAKTAATLRTSGRTSFG